MRWRSDATERRLTSSASGWWAVRAAQAPRCDPRAVPTNNRRLLVCGACHPDPFVRIYDRSIGVTNRIDGRGGTWPVSTGAKRSLQTRVVRPSRSGWTCAITTPRCRPASLRPASADGHLIAGDRVPRTRTERATPTSITSPASTLTSEPTRTTFRKNETLEYDVIPSHLYAWLDGGLRMAPGGRALTIGMLSKRST